MGESKVKHHPSELSVPSGNAKSYNNQLVASMIPITKMARSQRRLPKRLFGKSDRLASTDHVISYAAAPVLDTKPKARRRFEHKKVQAIELF